MNYWRKKMIKLGRLYIRNFKSFNNPKIFDFRNKDLVLFDGPNGFGKTTIFDAVELCFREDINRIQATDDKVKDTHPLKYDSKKETVICLEIINLNNDKSYAIYVALPRSENKKNNRIERGDIKFTMKRFILSSFPEELGKLENISHDAIFELQSDDKTIENIIGNPNLKNTFNIFNYIQQEETAHFLKLNESARHEAINHLFGTSYENEELDKLENIKKELNTNRLKKLEYKRDELKKELDKIELSAFENFNKFKEKEIIGSGKIFLLQELDKTDDITDERLSNLQKQLSTAQWVLENKDDFLKLRFNHLLDIMRTKRDDQLQALLYIGHYDDFKDIEKNEEKRNEIRIFKDRKRHFEIVINHHSTVMSTALTLDTINKYFSELGFKRFLKKKISFSEEINQLNRLNQEAKSYEKILSSISSARQKLKDEYQCLLEEIETNEIHCPLCGVKKESIEKLQKEYDTQSGVFEKLQNTTARKLHELSQILKENLLTPIYQRMQRYISMNKKVLFKEEIINKRIVNKMTWDAVQKTKKWLIANQINYTPYLFGTEENDNSLIFEDDRLQQLKEAINFKRIPLELQYSYDTIDDCLRSLNLMIDYKDDSELQLIDIKNNNILISENIQIDLEYINYLQHKKRHDTFQTKNKEYKKTCSRIELIKRKTTDISKIINLYKKEIREYERRVANEIAIPLYVYSSKILQTRLEGNGIFLKTPENIREKGFIRFSSSISDDHDAWNTMSSGQISGLIISFMLAMNKVYPTQLKVLLIDDPIQSMDEINMISFIQLLRYEFPDYQIIISTHDNKISNYFEYKYLTFEKKTKVINLKNLRLS